MIAHIPSHGVTKAFAILVGFFGITVYLMVRDGVIPEERLEDIRAAVMFWEQPDDT
jgi:hypothetical protein